MDDTVATTVEVSPMALNSALYVILALFVVFAVAAFVAWRRSNDLPDV